jgi:hypothetical protein
LDENNCVLEYSVCGEKQVGLQALVTLEFGLVKGGPDDGAFIPVFEPQG